MMNSRICLDPVSMSFLLMTDAFTGLVYVPTEPFSLLHNGCSIMSKPPFLVLPPSPTVLILQSPLLQVNGDTNQSPAVHSKNLSVLANSSSSPEP